MKARFHFICSLLFIAFAQPLYGQYCEVNAENAATQANELFDEYIKPLKNSAVSRGMLEAFFLDLLLAENLDDDCGLEVFETTYDFAISEVVLTFDEAVEPLEQYNIALLNLFSGEQNETPITSSGGDVKILTQDRGPLLLAVYTTCVTGAKSNLEIIIVDRDLLRCDTYEPAGPRSGGGEIGAGALAVFPNPAMDVVSIHYSLYQATNVQWQLYNALGQSMMEPQSMRQLAGVYTKQLAIEKLSKGHYFLHLKLADQTFVRKLFKH